MKRFKDLLPFLTEKQLSLDIEYDEAEKKKKEEEEQKEKERDEAMDDREFDKSFYQKGKKRS